MAIYSLMLPTTANRAPQVPIAELYTGTREIHILEIGVNWGTASLIPAVLGLGRPSNIGTPTATTTFLPFDPASPASTTTMGVAWGTNTPSVPTSFYRMINLNSNNTSTLTQYWHFPKGLVVLPSTSLVFWAFQGFNGGYVVEAVIDE